MSDTQDPPYLVWFFAVLFVLRVLFTGGVMVSMLFGADLHNAGNVSLLFPLGTLVVLAIRGVGFWRLIKLRRSAPYWLLAALLVSVVFSAVHFAFIGAERLLQQQGPVILVIEYTIATLAVGYAFSLRRRGVLKN